MPRFLPAVVLVSCLTPTLASAAEGNPAVEACKTLGEGDSCTTKEPVKGDDGVSYRNVEGSCQQDECCTQDYSKGSPPEVMCGPCLACKPGEAPAPSPTVSAEPEPPKAGDDPPASASTKRGCSLAGSGGTGWAMLAVGIALGLVSRRRR